jgi:bifunctional non-homologous end joining protein LigD
MKDSSEVVRSTAFPNHISPMLCTLVKVPPASTDYLFELKWDGYRIISYVQEGRVRMNSRSGLDYTDKYPLIAEALAALEHDVILDGEVVVFNNEDKPDFDALQLYNGQRTPIQYCVFDILSLDGNDLMQMLLVNRKELLKALTQDNPVFRFSESYEDGQTLYQQSLDENLEGIVAKDPHKETAGVCNWSLGGVYNLQIVQVALNWRLRKWQIHLDRQVGWGL